MRIALWPRSLLGRLIAASVLAVLVAELTAFALIARERENFVLQGNVREWTRRVAEITFMLQPLSASEREAAIARLIEQPRRFARSPGGAGARRRRAAAGLGPDAPPPGERSDPPVEVPSGGSPPESGPGDGPPPPSELDWMRSAPGRQSVLIPTRVHPAAAVTGLRADAQATAADDAGHGLPGFDPADADAPSVPFRFQRRSSIRVMHRACSYTTSAVGFPDGDSAVFRIGHLPRGAPLSRNLFFNLALLVVLLVIALYVTARSITRPLSKLVSAAESLGRNVRQPKLEEKGARELRDAARAFNTMQDRLQRYLDSRTRVLAAMSHDLKTPLTRLRLQVETTLDDSAIQARFGKELDEMESMVRGALALFRGLDDDETLAQIDINALVATLRSEFTEMGADVTVEGQARSPSWVSRRRSGAA